MTGTQHLGLMRASYEFLVWTNARSSASAGSAAATAKPRARHAGVNRSVFILLYLLHHLRGFPWVAAGAGLGARRHRGEAGSGGSLAIWGVWSDADGGGALWHQPHTPPHTLWRARRDLPSPRKLLRRLLRLARSPLRRLVEPARGGARRAGPQGRRQLSRRRALRRRRQDLCARGQSPLPRRRRRLLVRLGFPRPADGERRGLRPRLDVGGPRDVADPLLCAGHQYFQPQVGHRSRQRPRALHRQPPDRRVRARGEPLRLLRQRPCPGAGGVCRARARSRVPTTSC